ncbi:MAG: prepilin-type N-terminal cleavage/methylation domain-containing protein [bacterium]|nr:prepilin-type N-terminal cleavage/methylation domain-containing protein [bacterium]
MNKKANKKGFTLIELLIVIALIAIIAAVAFVALDPLTRFRDARDSARWTDATALLSAIKIDQVDNKGKYNWYIGTNASTSVVYQISNATTTSGCDTNCSVATSTNHCVNLQALADEGYLASLPVSPNGDGSWNSALSGYYMEKNVNGSITIGACEAENTASISVSQ